MKIEKYINSMFDFIKNSPSAFHTVNSIKNELLKAGYTELCESDKWNLANGGKYFVIRAGSSVIAFRHRAEPRSFMICASHSDFPSFRVKNSDESAKGEYVRLPVEKYGGAILYSWFDRPLSVAGRVVLRTESGIKSELINIDRDLLSIPSVAIHLNRGINDGFSPNVAVDMIPLYSILGNEKGIRDIAAEILSVDSKNILSHDLFLYVRCEPLKFGANREFLLTPRFDDLGCVFTSLEAFLSAKDTAATPVIAVFDNEEVGSDTKQGAASTFLSDILRRMCSDDVAYTCALSRSFMVSADNAHAKHPNHPEFSDSDNAPLLTGGIVIKHNANQKYATDAISDALFSQICERAEVKIQSYYNRADMPGGSTLGSISNTRVSVSTVDIGIPQLAMHSAVETAAVSDVIDMIKALTEFYSTEIKLDGNEISLLK